MTSHRFHSFDLGELAAAQCPWLTVEEAGRFCGIGRTAAYACVRNGEIPSLPLGRKRVVPTAKLREMLGV